MRTAVVDVSKCPKKILLASHFLNDGSCQCTHQACPTCVTGALHNRTPGYIFVSGPAGSGYLEPCGLCETKGAFPLLPEVPATPEKTTRTAEEVLRELCSDIECSGGLLENEDGALVPAGDPSWYDLANTYLHACEVLGCEPKIKKVGGDDEAPAAEEGG